MLCTIEINPINGEPGEDREIMQLEYTDDTQALFVLILQLVDRWGFSGKCSGRVSVGGVSWPFRASLDDDYEVWFVEYGDGLHNRLWA